MTGGRGQSRELDQNLALRCGAHERLERARRIVDPDDVGHERLGVDAARRERGESVRALGFE